MKAPALALLLLLATTPAHAFNILANDGLQSVAPSTAIEGTAITFRLGCIPSSCGGLILFNEAGQQLFFNEQGMLTTTRVVFPLPENFPVIEPVQFLVFHLVTFQGQWLETGTTVEDVPPVAATPEPTTLALWALTASAIGFMLRERRR